jgi:putative mRNA 3-end processing factor
VRESQAQQVYVTHGQSNVLARYLQEVEGISAEPLEGHFEAERFDDDAPTADSDGAATAVSSAAN